MGSQKCHRISTRIARDFMRKDCEDVRVSRLRPTTESSRASRFRPLSRANRKTGDQRLGTKSTEPQHVLDSHTCVFQKRQDSLFQEPRVSRLRRLFTLDHSLRHGTRLRDTRKPYGHSFNGHNSNARLLSTCISHYDVFYEDSRRAATGASTASTVLRSSTGAAASGCSGCLGCARSREIGRRERSLSPLVGSRRFRWVPRLDTRKKETRLYGYVFRTETSHRKKRTRARVRKWNPTESSTESPADGSVTQGCDLGHSDLRQAPSNARLDGIFHKKKGAKRDSCDGEQGRNWNGMRERRKKRQTHGAARPPHSLWANCTHATCWKIRTKKKER